MEKTELASVSTMIKVYIITIRTNSYHVSPYPMHWERQNIISMAFPP